MKRIGGVLFSVLVFLLVLFGIQHLRHAPTDSILGVQTGPTPQKVVPTPQVQAGIPVKISIPAIGMTAPVEQVGLDSQKRMDVPKVPTDAGWYDLGFKPGENGSAVIDGHYDLVTGAPSVFFYIKNLQNGDKVIVTDDKNNRYTFAVVNKVAYPFDQVPLEQVFNTQGTPLLNLITCSGVWDKATHNYSDRTVVYTKLLSRT